MFQLCLEDRPVNMVMTHESNVCTSHSALPRTVGIFDDESKIPFVALVQRTVTSITVKGEG